jgi:serine protease AprX
MKKNILVYLIIFLTSFELFAGNITLRVFFKDKGPDNFIDNPPTQLFLNTKNLLSEKSIERRKKVLSSPYMSIEDAPLYQPYLDSLIKSGAKIEAKLRWNNYCVITIDSIKLFKISTLPFVRSVKPVSSKLLLQSIKDISKETKYLVDTLNPLVFVECGEYLYGESFTQANILNVINLHKLGISGDGINIGVLDNGFRYNLHNAFKKSKIIKTWDFIYQDSIVWNEPNDVQNQDGHGTICLATICGYYPDKLIGIAPSSNLFLGKTEDMRGEKRIEEDYYAEGIEWLESSGADITTASLGYYSFDQGEELYSYEDMDGKSTIASNAINNAVKRGVVCFTPAGNNGPNPRTLITPGDADSSITIGSVGKEGIISSFSSRGNNSKGKIKPDLLAMGSQTFTVNGGTTDDFIRANGTSLSTPQMAGAASLILSVFPEIKPYELRQIMIKSASQFNNPDSVYGFGIPDIEKAIKSYDIAISPINQYNINNFKRVLVNVISKNEISNVKLYFKASNSSSFKLFETIKITGTDSYICDINISEFSNQNANCYIIAEDNNSRRRRYPYKEDTYFILTPDKKEIQCGISESSLPYYEISKQNSLIYPNLLEFNQEINIKLYSENESNLEITIYNSIGQEIKKFDAINLIKGINIHQINIGSLSIGNYIIKIKYFNKIDFHSFLIIR